MTKTIRLVSTLSDGYVESLAATFLDEQHFGTLIGGVDVDVLKPDGSPLLLFRHRALPAGVCKGAWPALRRAAIPSYNRGTAAGGRNARIKRDGTMSNTSYTRKAESGIIGYFDRVARFPYCRTTAYTRREIEEWSHVVPFAQAANAVFRQELPDRYQAQADMVRQTPEDFVIRGTMFTTMTVNRNFQTAVHRDKGDLKAGFGVMSVLRAGSYDGCYLVFPKYRIAVDMRSRDLLLADVHEWHGNTPFVPIDERYERISTIFYYRTNMRHCGTPAEELERVKNRKRGERLHPSQARS